MKHIYQISLLVFLFSFTQLQYASGQCKSTDAHIRWLSKMLRIQFTINEPKDINYTTEPSNIYEIPFAFNAYCAFVRAGKDGYFYLWTIKDHYNETVDYKKGDTLTFYLSNHMKIETTCYSDYDGIKAQSLSFYKLSKEQLDQLAITNLDSITVPNHPKLSSKSDDTAKSYQLLVLRRLSQHNVERIKEWAACLRKEL